MNSLDKSIEEYLHKINDRVWKTKDSRWNAVRRLKNQSQMSVFSISLLSIFGIAVPIMQIFIDSSECHSRNIDNRYTLTSILLSIFILVISILEGAKNHQVKAEILKNNAMGISSLSKEIDFLVNCKFKQANSEKEKQEIIIQVEQFYRDYDKLLKLCSENHKTEDYLLFQAQNYKYYFENNKSEKYKNHIKNTLKFIYYQWILIWLRIKYYWLYFMLFITITPIIISLYLSCPL